MQDSVSLWSSRYLQLLLLFDPLLLGVGDEDEDWPRLILLVLRGFSSRLLPGRTLRQETTRVIRGDNAQLWFLKNT